MCEEAELAARENQGADVRSLCRTWVFCIYRCVEARVKDMFTQVQTQNTKRMVTEDGADQDPHSEKCSFAEPQRLQTVDGSWEMSPRGLTHLASYLGD